MTEQKYEPQHLRLINSAMRWDWRKENPVELVLLVFIIAVFFAFPRAGCGVTYKANPSAAAPTAAAQAAPTQAAAAPAEN